MGWGVLRRGILDLVVTMSCKAKPMPSVPARRASKHARGAAIDCAARGAGGPKSSTQTVARRHRARACR